MAQLPCPILKNLGLQVSDNATPIYNYSQTKIDIIKKTTQQAGLSISMYLLTISIINILSLLFTLSS